MLEASETRGSRERQHNAPDPQEAANARRGYYPTLFDATR
jgi:hypothetical protein